MKAQADPGAGFVTRVRNGYYWSRHFGSGRFRAFATAVWGAWYLRHEAD